MCHECIEFNESNEDHQYVWKQIALPNGLRRLRGAQVQFNWTSFIDEEASMEIAHQRLINGSSTILRSALAKRCAGPHLSR